MHGISLSCVFLHLYSADSNECVCLNLNIIIIRGYSLFLTFFKAYEPYCGKGLGMLFRNVGSNYYTAILNIKLPVVKLRNFLGKLILFMLFSDNRICC